MLVQTNAITYKRACDNKKKKIKKQWLVLWYRQQFLRNFMLQEFYNIEKEFELQFVSFSNTLQVDARVHRL